MDFVHGGVAGIIGLSIDDGLDAAAKEGFEVTGCLAREVVIGGIGRNGFGQGCSLPFQEAAAKVTLRHCR